MFVHYLVIVFQLKIENEIKNVAHEARLQGQRILQSIAVSWLASIIRTCALAQVPQ